MNSKTTEKVSEVKIVYPQLVRALSSTKLGMVLFGAIVAYLTVASTVPQLRLWLDRTELGVYGWWPHVALWIMLCVNMAAATLLRIGLRWSNLGAWAAHGGVMLVALGSVWYAGHKIDGDIAIARIGPGRFEPVGHFYDARIRAMYATVEGDTPSETIIQTPLLDLPLRKKAGELAIPVAVESEDMSVRVTDYRPFAAVVEKWDDGGTEPRPGAEVTLGYGPAVRSFTLVPGVAGQAIIDGPGFTLEYRPEIVTEEEMDALVVGAEPTHVLDIRYKGEQVRQGVAALVGDAVDLPEIGYRVEVMGFHRRNLHAGCDHQEGDGAHEHDYEAEAVPMLVLRVSALEGAEFGASAKAPFHRFVLAGRPDEASDLSMTEATESRLIDEDLEISYTFNESLAVDGDVLILVGAEGGLSSLLWQSPTGLRGRFDLAVGEPVEVYGHEETDGVGRDRRKLVLTLDRWLSRATRRVDVVDESPADGRAAVRVEVEGHDWKRQAWVPFEHDPRTSPSTKIQLPDGRKLALQFSRLQRPLGATLRVRELTFETFPGSSTPKDYICRLEVLRGSEIGMQIEPAEVRLNQPISVGQFRISQQAWDMNDPYRPSYTVLGVTNRPALPVIWAGCVMILAAFPYAFYVKPLLRRREAAKGGRA